MRSPSQSRTLLATAATLASRARTSIAAEIHAAPGRASLLMKARNSPRAWAAPRLQPPENPVFVGDSTTVAPGTASRMRCALPSPEALSTTTSSSCSAGHSTPSNERRQVMVSSAPRKLTRTTDTKEIQRMFYTY